MYELKIYRGTICHENERDAKLEEELTCRFKSQMRTLMNFKPSTRWDPFIQSRKCMSLKLTGKLCAMAMQNEAKFKGELTCQFNIDMRNLTNFDLSTQKSQKFAL